MDRQREVVPKRRGTRVNSSCTCAGLGPGDWQTTTFIQSQWLGWEWCSKHGVEISRLFFTQGFVGQQIDFKQLDFLRKVCQLFSVRTLYRVLRNTDVYPGFNRQIIEALRWKASSMGELSTLCAISMDKMSVNERLSYNARNHEVKGLEDFGSLGKSKYVSDHAIAFMVRRLVDKWKQPIGYFRSSGRMSASTMNSLLFEYIKKPADVRHDVKVGICDQGFNNRNFFETVYIVNQINPYFLASDKKVYVLYYPPHLIKMWETT